MSDTDSNRKILEVEDLHVRYGRFHAVRGIDLVLHQGQTLALLGPNGSGKSSTLSAITGLIATDSGKIRIDGIDLAEDPNACRLRLGVVPQEFAFYEEMSPRENLMFVGRLYGLHGTRLRRRVREALDFVSLGDRATRPAGTLSGGMQRRLNLACAILHNPMLLLLDEPTVGLDISSRDAIYHLLEALADQGCSIILTTHHLHEAQLFCERIALMRKGNIIAQGTLEELRQMSVPFKDPEFHHPEFSSDFHPTHEFHKRDRLEHSHGPQVPPHQAHPHQVNQHMGHGLKGPRSSELDLEQIYSRLISGTVQNGLTAPEARS